MYTKRNLVSAIIAVCMLLAVTNVAQAQVSDLAAFKAVDDPTPNEGDLITYTVTVTNNGPDAATNAEVTDVLPVDVTFVSSSDPSYDPSIGDNVWNVGALNSSSSATLTITVTVDAGTGGTTIINTACVTANQTDPAPENNCVSEEINVISVETVDIDIKPGSYPNSINVKAKGLIPVAILGSKDFDVTLIDVATVEFGPAQAEPAHDLTDPDVYSEHLEDVNLDSFLDIVFHFRTQESGLTHGDIEATLTGDLLAGLGSFSGTDSIIVVGGGH